jgi:hypothetical protein
VQLGRNAAAPDMPGAPPAPAAAAAGAAGGSGAPLVSSSAVGGDTGDGGVTPVHHGAIMDLRAALVEMGRWQRRCMDMEAALDEVGGVCACLCGGRCCGG